VVVGSLQRRGGEKGGAAVAARWPDPSADGRSTRTIDRCATSWTSTAAAR
jgi:hypothetical protein